MLNDPTIQKLDVGSPEYLKHQRHLIEQRPLVKRCYTLWYRYQMEDINTVARDGIKVELGSGGSFLKEYCPELITSDIAPGVADMVIDARKLPFDNHTVKAITMTHCFHHIPNLESFLKEADRVLVPGGVISLIDCAHTPFAKFFFDKFHPEPYDDTKKSWDVIETTDKMWSANQALSWMVFFRDRKILKEIVPSFEVETTHLLPWASYILSGGVTRQNLIPRNFTGLIKILDKILSPIDRFFSLHWHIRIRKVS